jgi:hypothetical protein
VLKRIFGPKRDEVSGGWWKMHYEELNNLYSAPNVIRVIKSRRRRRRRRRKAGREKTTWESDVEGFIGLTLK